MEAIKAQRSENVFVLYEQSETCPISSRKINSIFCSRLLFRQTAITPLSPPLLLLRVVNSPPPAASGLHSPDYFQVKYFT